MIDKSASKAHRMLMAVCVGGIALLPMQAGSESAQLAQQPANWQQANEQVGQFLRGHMDILKAESRSATSAKASESAASRGELLILETARQRALEARPSLFTAGALSAAEQSIQLATVTALLADVQRAWTQAVGAQILLSHQENATQAAQIGYELAQRMGKVGNWGEDRVIAAGLLSKSEHLRLLQVRQQAELARQSLASLVLTDAFDLPQALPEIRGIGANHDLRSTPQELALERLSRMPDYASDRQALDQARAAAGPQALAQWQTYAQKRIEAVAKGDSPLALSVDPAAVLWTHEIRQALHQAQALALREQESRTTIAKAQSTVKALHAQTMLIGNEMLALARQAEEEAVYQYNGMFISTWRLLDQYRARVATEISHVQSQMDYWDALYAFRAYLAGAPYKPPSGGQPNAGGSASDAAGGH